MDPMIPAGGMLDWGALVWGALVWGALVWGAQQRALTS